VPRVTLVARVGVDERALGDKVLDHADEKERIALRAAVEEHGQSVEGGTAVRPSREPLAQVGRDILFAQHP